MTLTVASRTLLGVPLLIFFYPFFDSLPSAGKYLGREAISQVAERRKVDIEKFLVSLFSMADEVAHSDIVYTFFHPLLRDQEEANIDSKKHKGWFQVFQILKVFNFFLQGRELWKLGVVM